MLLLSRTDKRSDVGATAVEYAILASAIAAVIISVVFLVGGNTFRYFETFWLLFSTY